MFMRSSQSVISTKEIALKIYGERNTGTNYLAALAELNLCAKVLPGRVADNDMLTQVTRRLSRYLPHLGRKWHEAARDRFFEATFSDNLGWKHMNPNPARIGQEALASVRFLMVIKNPYAWLLSLHQRPYHVGVRDGSFEHFLTRRLPVMEQRENIGSDALTAIEVWNRKVQGYIQLQDVASHAVIMRYEDFLVDEITALHTVATKLGIAIRDRHIPVSEGVKQADTKISHSDYASYYLKERWRERLSPEALGIINSSLDQEAVKQFSYQVI